MLLLRNSFMNIWYLYALQFWIILSIIDFEVSSTWITVPFGVLVGWLVLVLFKTVFLCRKLELTEPTNDPVEDSEDESELNPDFQLPYFSDESDFEYDESTRPKSSSLGSATSGYSTDPEIDLDWEYYKILHAPPGPVPPDQVYLTFSCQITGFYVKAIVDKNHSMIRILNYEKLNYGVWCWTETNCSSCISKVRKALDAGGCQVPFAMDLEEEYDANSESEDIDRGGSKKKVKVPKKRSQLY
ncbi:hypothetical protein CAEBREN_06961 [Caenorhabditis brenneri]|uniref:Uncharacterized protein n=1 Tax=Caenorhabditis brenneri TaxID=135651 RepID=G0P5U9_CAEBE|nr:hypothetical protein CAEBREN_06961 [Caenorhabditis brenneri]